MLYRSLDSYTVFIYFLFFHFCFYQFHEERIPQDAIDSLSNIKPTVLPCLTCNACYSGYIYRVEGTVNCLFLWSQKASRLITVVLCGLDSFSIARYCIYISYSMVLHIIRADILRVA